MSIIIFSILHGNYFELNSIKYYTFSMQGALKYLGLTMDTWYITISKPFWAPPVWIYGLAWGALYPLIFLSFGYTFWKSFFKREWPLYIGLLFLANLVFNLIFAIGIYAVFTQDQTIDNVRQYYWPAAYIVTGALVTLPFMIYFTWSRSRWVAICQLPYLLWLIVATALQIYFALTSSA